MERNTPRTACRRHRLFCLHKRKTITLPKRVDCIRIKYPPKSPFELVHISSYRGVHDLEISPRFGLVESVDFAPVKHGPTLNECARFLCLVSLPSAGLAL